MTPIAAIARSGIAAATLRLGSSASNIANGDDTSAVDAGRHQPTEVQDSAMPGGGVTARAVTMKPGTMVIYDPTAAAAGARGFVQAPEIDPISEVSDMLRAGRAFAFSVKVLKSADEDEQTALDLKT